MLFHEPFFALVIAPAFYALYLLVNDREAAKKWALIAASVAFYTWGEPLFVPVVLVSTLIDYVLFEDAMRESELDELKKQVQNVGQETEAAMREAETSIEKHLGDARASIDPDKMLGADPFAEPAAPPAPAASDATAAPMPASSDPIADTPPPAATPPETAARAAEKTGA